MVIVVDDKGVVRFFFLRYPVQAMADDLAALLQDAASASARPQIQVENTWDELCQKWCLPANSIW